MIVAAAMSLRSDSRPQRCIALAITMIARPSAIIDR